MSGNVTLKGTIVDKDPSSPFPANPNYGLFLLTEDNTLIELIAYNMAAQVHIESLHIMSRSIFEPYLGKEVTVKGYLSGSTLRSAMIVEKEEID